jgi:hypothetical protein
MPWLKFGNIPDGIGVTGRWVRQIGGSNTINEGKDYTNEKIIFCTPGQLVGKLTYIRQDLSADIVFDQYGTELDGNNRYIWSKITTIPAAHFDKKIRIIFHKSRFWNVFEIFFATPTAK